MRAEKAAVAAFSIGMIGLGTLAIVYGDFALVWQPVPTWIPGRSILAYGCGILMLCSGLGILFEKTAKWSSRALLVYVIAWTMLKVPPVIASPQIAGVWLGLGELTVLLSGGWVLLAQAGRVPEWSALGYVTSEDGIRTAKVLFGLSLIP